METRKAMHWILNIKFRACDVLNKIPTGKIHPGKSEKSVIPDINSKMALDYCTSQFFEKNVIKLCEDHIFILNFLLFPAKSISRDAALPSLTVVWRLHCLLSFLKWKLSSGNWFYKEQSNSLSLFVLWENFQSNL